MIWESSLWKRELETQASVLNTAKLDRDESVPFDVERALFYTAFIVRKLLENNKLTDGTANELVSVDVFDAKSDRSQRLSVQASGFFELGEEFDDTSKNSIQMKFGDLASEIIHSFALIWEVSEHENLVGAFVSSYRNHKKRAVHVSFNDWISLLKKIIEDEVTNVVVKVDPSTGALVRANS